MTDSIAETHKKLQDSTLKEWDLSFSINGEVLTNMLTFFSDINEEVPFQFYKEKIIVLILDIGNLQFSDTTINITSVLDYKYNVTKEDIDDHKLVSIYSKSVLGNLKKYAEKDDIIKVRIDTVYTRRVEFHCPGNVVIYAMISNKPIMVNIKKADSLPAMIAKTRSSPDIPKAKCTIEVGTFARMCATISTIGIVAWELKNIFITINKRGLFVASGNKRSGTLFKVLNKTSEELAEDIDSQKIDAENMLDKIIEESEKADKLDKFIDSDKNDISDEISKDDLKNLINDLKEEYQREYETMVAFKNRAYKNAKSTSSGNTGTILDQLLDISVDNENTIYIRGDLMFPLLKTKGLSPITMEISSGRYLILETKPYDGIYVSLSIAIRSEDQE